MSIWGTRRVHNNYTKKKSLNNKLLKFADFFFDIMTFGVLRQLLYSALLKFSFQNNGVCIKYIMQCNKKML